MPLAPVVPLSDPGVVVPDAVVPLVVALGDSAVVGAIVPLVVVLSTQVFTKVTVLTDGLITFLLASLYTTVPSVMPNGISLNTKDPSFCFSPYKKKTK